MRIWSTYALVALLAGSLSACGGGGGGSGATAPLTVAVNVNGSVATAGTDGTFAVKPGDVVEVTPSQAADWSSASAVANAITVRNPDVAAAKWKGQIQNSTTAPSNFTVSAKASANAALVKDAVFKVSAGDARNAQYRVFATNGTKQTLALDFDTMSYTMTDASGAVATDAFKADPTPANGYIFASSRITATANTARFRLADHTVIGSFPFTQPGSTTAFAVQPFVATNAMVTVQSELAGAYNRLGIQTTSTTRDSNIRQVWVPTGGTQMLMCNDLAITAPAHCTPANLLTYNITPGATAMDWNIQNVANPSDSGTFSVAKIGGDNVYLSAGANPLGAPGERVFRVGVAQQPAWPAIAAHVTDTDGTWGTLSLDATTFATSFTRPDGSAGSLNLPVTPGPVNTDLNIRFASPGTSGYFVYQGTKVVAAVGARQGPYAGYLQVGLID